MPIFQIVSSGRHLIYEDIYKALSKMVTTLLLDGWKCQGGVTGIYQDGTLLELIQAMILD